MKDEEKFTGFKKQLIQDNEEHYGTEARSRYGNEAVDAANAKMMGLSQDEFKRFETIGHEIAQIIEAGVTSSADPSGPEGKKAYELHREWLGFTWTFYTPEAHKGLADGYVADERFRAYYDREVPGCAQWLRDAIRAHA